MNHFISNARKSKTLSFFERKKNLTLCPFSSPFDHTDPRDYH